MTQPNSPKSDAQRPGTGNETWYTTSDTATCPVCKQEVPVDRDHKRTWFKSHPPAPTR